MYGELQCTEYMLYVTNIPCNKFLHIYIYTAFTLYYSIHTYTILYTAILHYTQLYYTIHNYTTLYTAILHDTQLYCTMHNYTTLYIAILHYTSKNLQEVTGSKSSPK